MYFGQLSQELKDAIKDLVHDQDFQERVFKDKVLVKYEEMIEKYKRSPEEFDSMDEDPIQQLDLRGCYLVCTRLKEKGYIKTQQEFDDLIDKMHKGQ